MDELDHGNTELFTMFFLKKFGRKGVRFCILLSIQ